MRIEHKNEVRRWIKARNLPISALPRRGYFRPAAAMFMIGAESGFCFIDPVISNPDASPKEVHAAIVDLTTELCIKAKEHGYTRIVALSDKRSIIRIAKNLDFKEFKISYLVRGT